MSVRNWDSFGFVWRCDLVIPFIRVTLDEVLTTLAFPFLIEFL